ncbi:MAG: hypothetical protein LH617_10815 [Ramlibacter sp.]|nr:hypothetical protein [Ramlibacter sp.]
MMIRACFAAIALLVLAPALAQQTSGPACPPSDRACVMQAVRNHAVRRVDSWQAELARPLDDRIGAAPPHLIEYLTLDNTVQGIAQRPRPAVLEPEFLVDVKAAIRELPPQVWRLFRERLIGVYFVENLGGTGFSDAVTDRAGNRVAGYIVLDAAVLRPLKANAWATWKEGTPFKPKAGYALAARIEAEAGDNRKNAIQYILLHELGHVFSVGNVLHPPWELEPKDVPVSAVYPYFDLSWSIDRRASRYASRFDKEFPQRRNVAYYFGAKLASAEMAATYSNLERTNFPTLYAATHPGDDFAEAFASYVHVVLQRRPWQITISRDGKTVKVFTPCWDEPRCADKRKVLERIVGR